MAFLRVIARAGVLISLCAATLRAQGRHSYVIAEPQGQPRIGSIAPAPTAPPQPLTYGQTVFANYPPILSVDSQLFIDPGNGYQEVARTCPYAYGDACQSFGFPRWQLSPGFQQYVPATDAPQRFAPPAYAAPTYPVPTYSGGVYRNSSSPAPQRPSSAASYSNSPVGYGGSVERARAPSAPAFHAAPAAPSRGTSGPLVVTRRP